MPLSPGSRVIEDGLSVQTSVLWFLNFDRVELKLTWSLLAFLHAKPGQDWAIWSHFNPHLACPLYFCFLSQTFNNKLLILTSECLTLFSWFVHLQSYCSLTMWWFYWSLANFGSSPQNCLWIDKYPFILF